MTDDGLKKGTRAYVVLDCIPLERDGIPYRRVIVRGVYADELDAPPPLEDAARNAVGVFIGLDMKTPAFLIEYPVARESPAVIVSRDDLRAVTAGAIPADVRKRFLEALGEGS